LRIASEVRKCKAEREEVQAELCGLETVTEASKDAEMKAGRKKEMIRILDQPIGQANSALVCRRPGDGAENRTVV
jgi:hypothetical protein